MHLEKILSILTKEIFCSTSSLCKTFVKRTYYTYTYPCQACHGYFLARKAHSSTKKTRSLKGKTLNHGSNEDRLEELMLSLKEKASKRSSYAFEESLAKKLVSSIISNRLNPKAPVLEIGPGIGLVSKEFLNQGLEQVIALETEKVFHSYLQLVQQEYGEEKFQFYNWNMLNIFDKFNDCSPKETGSSYKTMESAVVERLSRSDFADAETPCSLFTIGGSQENHNFIFYILRNLPNEDPILTKERVEFFFLVHPKFKISVEEILPIDKPSNYTRYYSYFHTLICLMYDVTFIDEFEVNEFMPPFSKTGSSRRINPHKRHLVRMQLKANISRILPLDHHYAFSIFLRHIFRKRKIRIVPVMEMLVSGCGLQMLAEGFTMMETVADVSPQRLLQLYKSMLCWPEYSVSHLKNHILMKTQGGPMEDEDL